jgi:hypothetical protein
MNVLRRRPGAQPTPTLAKRIWVLSGLIGILAASLTSAKVAESDPFATVEEALRLRKALTDSELDAFLGEQLRVADTKDTNRLLLIAELMKQAGDYSAENYFWQAIDHADEEAAYELFYADYLRNFRGPQRPLFKEAEEHYFAALEKLRQQRSPPPWSEEVRKRVLRGLVVLYQEDGIPLAWREDTEPRAPFLFLSSKYRIAEATSDLDEIHDVRDWTAEALFSQSAVRLNRALTREELGGLVRRKEPTVLYERLRYRVGGTAIDFSYEGRTIENAQITDFRRPNDFNRVRVDDLGAEFARAFNGAPSFDSYFRQAFHFANRQGLVESQPKADEEVFQWETEMGFSRFSRSSKTNFSLIWVGQEINPQIANPPRRSRHIIALGLDRQILRPFRGLRDPFRDRFATRGVHIFGGVADDREYFDDVEVRRNDFYMGTSFNGLGPFDVILQPAVFKQRVAGDKSQTSSQLRLDGTIVLRLLDEERNPGIPRSFLGLRPAFVHLVIPARQDHALKGLSAFENDRVGVGVDMKFFVMPFDASAPASNARFGAATLLLSGRYSRERFPRLDKKVNLMEWSFSLGY